MKQAPIDPVTEALSLIDQGVNKLVLLALAGLTQKPVEPVAVVCDAIKSN